MIQSAKHQGAVQGDGSSAGGEEAPSGGWKGKEREVVASMLEGLSTGNKRKTSL